jgi:hypothetical protein
MLASASDRAFALGLLSLMTMVLFAAMVLGLVGLIVFLVQDYVKDRRRRRLGS